MVEIIGAPFDLAGHNLGSRLGPAALRLAGLPEALESVGQEVLDSGDLSFITRDLKGKGIRFFEEAYPSVIETRVTVKTSIEQGRMPLVLGGDHSIAIGAISGALDATKGQMSLLWMDAHTDINTPWTTPSGRLHGMPVAALLDLPSGVKGLVDEQWRKLVPDYPLAPSCLAYYGIRDLDAGEQETLRCIPSGYSATMYEIDRNGIVKSLQRFDRWMRKTGCEHLWISFDVDVLDPILAPGTGTAVRGGLTYREGHLAAEILRELLDSPGCPYKLIGLDVVETNPLVDQNNATAKTVVEWIASLFGKTILGKR